jgi:hypothetical protein
MGSENGRLRELDHLIRAAHAELGTLQFLLINAHERKLNPAELGIRIANLGHHISVWKRERDFFSRHIPESSQPAIDPSQNNGSVPESPHSRRPASLKKSNSRHQIREQAVSLELLFT